MPDAIDDLIAGLEGAVQEALDSVATKAVEVARKRSRGDLAASIRVRNVGRFGREIVSDAPYAGFVENGRPGFSAAPGKMLHFVIGGRDVFVRSVGPAKPHPFMAPAGEYLRANASAAVEKALGSLT